MCEFWQQLIVFKLIGSELDAREEIYIIQIHHGSRHGSFPGIWFEFIYPQNSYLFFAIPQICVAADENKIYSPVLLWNKHLPTCIYVYLRTHANKAVTDRHTNFVNKHFITISLFALYKPRNTCK